MQAHLGHLQTHLLYQHRSVHQSCLEVKHLNNLVRDALEGEEVFLQSIKHIKLW